MTNTGDSETPKNTLIVDPLFDHLKYDGAKIFSLTKPSYACTIAVKSLKYSVKVRQKRRKWQFSSHCEEKVILNELSAVFRPGKLTAIMGASGAGKTSLLNVLAGEINEGYLEGKILVNGMPISPSKMRKVSGFVFQDDIILPTMTPREAITMSSILRLPNKIDTAQKQSLVDEVLHTLHLEKAADTIVGSATIKGISGGERKRTSIGMELVINPSILFLDEPTSGLDTFTAYKVIECLSNLAHENRTIVATIHQPSSEIFYLFDDLILLSEGEIVYAGQISKVVAYFGLFGYHCPTYNNPSDFIFMNILNSTEESTLKEPNSNNNSGGVSERMSYLKLSWKVSDENKYILDAFDHLNDTKQDLDLASLKHTTFFSAQFCYLIKGAWKNMIRSKMAFSVKLLQAVFIGLLVALIYKDIPSRPFQAQIQDREGSLYFLTINSFMSAIMTVLGIFYEEKQVLIREYKSGYYTLFSYFLTKILDESLGILTGSIFDGMKVALAVVSIILMPLMIFSGLFVNTGSIPPYFSWIQYISPTKYAYSSLIQNEFTTLVLHDCMIGNETVPSCSGKMAITALNMNYDFGILGNALMLVMFLFVYLISSYCFLWFSIRRRRKKLRFTHDDSLNLPTPMQNSY